MMAPVISIATGLLIFIVLITFAPTIASSVQNAQPDLGPNSTWNSDAPEGADLPSGVDQWTTNIQILGVVILIISIAVAMYFLKGMA